MVNKQTIETFSACDWGARQDWLLQYSVWFFITTATHNVEKGGYFYV